MLSSPSYIRDCPFCGAKGSTEPGNFQYSRDFVTDWVQDGKTQGKAPVGGGLTIKANPVCKKCSAILSEEVMTEFEKAQMAERVGRHEDAAICYENLKMYDKALKIRERGKHTTTTVRQVSVDLNSLIEQIRAGGLSVPYRCPSCGATITIDDHTKAGGLRFCSYCGTTINTDALTTVIKQALVD